MCCTAATFVLLDIPLIVLDKDADYFVCPVTSDCVIYHILKTTIHTLFPTKYCVKLSTVLCPVWAPNMNKAFFPYFCLLKFWCFLWSMKCGIPSLYSFSCLLQFSSLLSGVICRPAEALRL
jgi:hypothetical protein